MHFLSTLPQSLALCPFPADFGEATRSSGPLSRGPLAPRQADPGMWGSSSCQATRGAHTLLANAANSMHEHFVQSISDNFGESVFRSWLPSSQETRCSVKDECAVWYLRCPQCLLNELEI